MLVYIKHTNCASCIILWHSYCISSDDKKEFLYSFTIVFAASCAPGTFYNITRNECQYCPLHHYQNGSGQTSCIPCPHGMITRIEGAISADICNGKLSNFVN